MRDQARASLHVDDPAAANAIIDRKAFSSRKEEQEARQSVAEFNKLVARSVVPADATVRFRELDGRSHYHEGQIMLGKGAGRAVGVHEMGHWLEEINPSIQARVFAFLERRTAGDPIQTMNEATGLNYYRSDEITRTDRFINAYMGKQYREGSYGRRYASEILSMGLEMFYSNPIRLARLDPEYFDFIFAVVRGLEL